MSSGFVSGGTTDQLIERDDEWLKAQQEIEATRRRKEEESRQEGGKTLYEVLQQNKAAKQEAIEESLRLKNQFRNLDEDEIEFLDSVLESTRAKEEAVKKETKEQLDLFRRQQEEADKALLDAAGNDSPATPAAAGRPPAEESQWAVNARKRKRAKEKEVLKGVKLRKSSTSEQVVASKSTEHHSVISIPTAESSPSNSQAMSNEDQTPVKAADTKTGTGTHPDPTEDRSVEHISSPASRAEPTNGGLPSLGLGDYSSDDES
ncbi:MAG: hypothetical protein FRX48_09123 [Lasallia pustulata]|uniref:FAM192A/Fyv6 N-terminal domain-containing protein n=1 Tax=Lasallia pustulata TaxID=136370 RepID=A0A5M8PCM4_9LECA|nr:MAG: hypothetical protein FRX48_09123 [Lasallia pustulata]